MTRGFSWVFIGLGAIAVVAGLTVDMLGYGQYPGLGWKQWLSIAVGLALMIAGVLIRRSRQVRTRND